MPWKRTRPVDERLDFIAAHHSGLYSMSELCLRFGISRRIGYKWLHRYEAEGPPGLLARSHAPQHCPHKLSTEIEAVLLEAKCAHPSWGPRKILPYLARRRPDLVLPVASTAGELFRRNGLTECKRRRRGHRHPGASPLVAGAPNEVWTADFKGQFKTGDGLYCFPLTIADAYSRYLLACAARLSVKQIEAQPVFEALFREYGLPSAIRTDNGAPFATPAFCGLSKLSVWWIKLGIRHQRIEPGRPEQNGAHERMHRTLKAEATRPPERDQAAQQRRFNRFCAEYNQERPHEALGQQVPVSRYDVSSREMPERLPRPEYPGHFEIRRVSRAGTFRFQTRQLFLSDTLLEEDIGLEETDDGIWSIYFFDVLLARLDERDFRLRP
jgi:transposase InsO family protein